MMIRFVIVVLTAVLTTVQSVAAQNQQPTDFQLACNTDGQVEEKLYGVEHSQYANCLCDSSNMEIDCTYGDPIHYDDDGNYSVQEYYIWNFDTDSGQFSFVDHCYWCEDGACLENTTVYDSSCIAVGFDGLQKPTTCAVTHASSAPEYCEWYKDCQVCTTTAGWYGVAPTDTECFFATDESESECIADPYFYNPFLKLREEAESSGLNEEAESSGSNEEAESSGSNEEAESSGSNEEAESSGSNVGAIVGSIFGVLLFIVIGGGIYYYLHTGKCPRLPACRKCRGVHYAKRDATTFSKKLNTSTTNDPTHEDKWSELLREDRFLEPFEPDAGKALDSIRLAGNNIDLADPTSLGIFFRAKTPQNVPNAFLTKDSETTNPIVIHNVQIPSTFKPGEHPNVYAFWGVETDADPFWLKATQVAKMFNKETHFIPHMDKLLDLANLDDDSFAGITLINEVDPGPGVMLADGVTPAQDANKKYDESHELTQASYLHPKIAAAVMDHLDLHPDAKPKDLFTVIKDACERPNDNPDDAKTFETQWVLETLRFLWVMCNTAATTEDFDLAVARDRSEAMQIKKTTLDTYFKKTVPKSQLTNKYDTGGPPAGGGGGRDSNQNMEELLRRQVEASERAARFQSFAVVSEFVLSLFSKIKTEQEQRDDTEQPDDVEAVEREANAMTALHIVETCKQLPGVYQAFRSLFPKKNTEQEQSDDTEPDQERGE